MSLFNIVMQSSFLSKGCKLYYNHLVNLNKASIRNNWQIASGKYENNTFILATDTVVAKKLNMGLTSIYKYKKTLESLGLIAILPKFTVRTNLPKCKNYYHRQITIVNKNMPRQLISKLLTFINGIKNARILKTSTSIVSQLRENFKGIVGNIHTKINKVVNAVKNTTHINNSSKDLNNEDAQTVVNMLNTYNIKFKNREIKNYIELYKTNRSKFTETCKYCSVKYMYAPLKYFTKVFTTEHKIKNNFWNFAQKERNKQDWEDLENLLIER